MCDIHQGWFGHCMICPEWHDMITKLAWLLLQRHCMKSASSGNQIKIDLHKKKNALWCTLPQLQIYTWKTADAKCIFVWNAQYLNYNDEVYKMMEYDGICWTIIAGVNLFKWKLFTEFVSHTTWGVSFIKKHAKNLIIAAQDCTQWPFIQHTLDIFPIWLCAFEIPFGPHSGLPLWCSQMKCFVVLCCWK